MQAKRVYKLTNKGKNKTTPSVSARGRQEMECHKILHNFFFLLG
jgi:hypothetical protein